MQIQLAQQIGLEERLAVILPQVVALEHKHYPASEAASEERLKQRLQDCAAYFLLLKQDDGTVVGYACGTRGYHLSTSEAMGKHDPSGPILLLHSVLVDTPLQRKGWALKLVEAFCAAGGDLPVHLICKSHLLALYNQAGFSLVGPSKVVHGAEPWFEMKRLFNTNPAMCVDAFALHPFQGNAAGVVLLPDAPFINHPTKRAKPEADVEYFKLVAREINASETAFVQCVPPTQYFEATELSLDSLLGEDCHLTFNESLACVAKHFTFANNVSLRVGEFQSALGQNVGSLKTLAFGMLAAGLTDVPSVARLWREHYDMVLAHPDTELDKHLNIRWFLKNGPVVFTNDKNEVVVSPITGVDVNGLAFLLKHCKLDAVFDSLHGLPELLAKHAPQSTLQELRAWVRGTGPVVPTASAELLSLLPQSLGRDVNHVLNGQTLHCSIRWFTPTGYEIDLCGHATLAAAYALFYEIGPVAQRNDFTEICFTTQTAGKLFARRVAAGKQVELDFPLQQEITALQEKIDWQSAFPQSQSGDIEFAGVGMFRQVMLQVTSQEALAKRFHVVDSQWMKANLAAYAGVIVSAKAQEKEADICTRFFAPMIGIEEDPATGSAHCTLAKYWGDKLNKQEIVSMQHSKRGVAKIVCRMGHAGDRVKLIGGGRVAWKGEIAN